MQSNGNPIWQPQSYRTYTVSQSESGRCSMLRILSVFAMSFSQNQRIFIVKEYYESRLYKFIRSLLKNSWIKNYPLKSSISRLIQKFESIARYTPFANITNRRTKLFFRQIKYCRRKRDERVAVHCSLFDFFFDEKVLCVRRRDRYPDANPAYGVRQKTCSWNMANTFYRLFAISPLHTIRHCSQTVTKLLFCEKN